MTTAIQQGIKVLETARQMITANLRGATGSEQARLMGELAGIEARIAELKARG